MKGFLNFRKPTVTYNSNGTINGLEDFNTYEINPDYDSCMSYSKKVDYVTFKNKKRVDLTYKHYGNKIEFFDIKGDSKKPVFVLKR